MEIVGKLIVKNDEQVISDKFKKRDLVVEHSENPQYPELISFQLIQDKTDLIDPFEVGQEITVGFNLKGRKWTNPKGEDVYFNTLQAWKIQPAGQAASAPLAAKTKEPEWLADNEEAEEDLPF